jgi:hypothetical protein
MVEAALADVPATCDFNRLICPARTNARSARKSEFPKLSSRPRLGVERFGEFAKLNFPPHHAYRSRTGREPCGIRSMHFESEGVQLLPLTPEEIADAMPRTAR